MAPKRPIVPTHSLSIFLMTIFYTSTLFLLNLLSKFSGKP